MLLLKLLLCPDKIIAVVFLVDQFVNFYPFIVLATVPFVVIVGTHEIALCQMQRSQRSSQRPLFSLCPLLLLQLQRVR